MKPGPNHWPRHISGARLQAHDPGLAAEVLHRVTDNSIMHSDRAGGLPAAIHTPSTLALVLHLVFFVFFFFSFLFFNFFFSFSFVDSE